MARGLIVAVALALSMACGSSPNESADDALNRGLKARAAGDLDGATRAYYEVLSKDPRNKYALFDLGEIAQHQNRMVEAEAFYRLSLAQDKNFTPPLFNLAIVRTVAGDTTEALDLYRRTVASDPTFGEGHFNLGILLRQLGQTAEAQQELATAQLLNPSLAAPAPAPSPSPTSRP
jgi:tetratricopeptide (TPR) repeat protein